MDMSESFGSFAASAALATVAVWVTGAGLLWLRVLVNRLPVHDPRRLWWNRLLREHVVFLWSWTAPFRLLWGFYPFPPGLRDSALSVTSLCIVFITGKFLWDQMQLWARIRS